MNASRTINIEPASRGAWEVVLPAGAPVVCPTLAEAMRAGARAAAEADACELVVHDAYHRVLRRERFAGVRTGG